MGRRVEIGYHNISIGGAVVEGVPCRSKVLIPVEDDQGVAIISRRDISTEGGRDVLPAGLTTIGVTRSGTPHDLYKSIMAVACSPSTGVAGN